MRFGYNLNVPLFGGTFCAIGIWKRNRRDARRRVATAAPRPNQTTMPTALATTPLHDWHIAHGARMVDFAGWSMPVQYTSVVEEHNATRQLRTLFDVSHMGRFRFTGPGAVAFLDRLLTRRVTSLSRG